MALDLTSFDAALKQHYTSDMVQNMVYKDNPFLALVAKYEDFGGRNLPIVLIYGNPQNRSATFATAQAGTSNSKLEDFILTRVKDYSIATIDNETLEASKGNANAFMEAATVEIDGSINSLTRSVAISLFRDSSGYIGQLNAEPTEVVSPFVIQLKSAEDVTNFELGQVLVVFADKSGGSARTSNGTLASFPIVGINRSTGALTVTGAYDASGTIAADDYIFVNGDRGLKISGMEGWVPASAPSSTAFFGVDRSVDTRLGGLRLTGTSLPIEEALINGASLCAREGGKIDHFFMSYAKYAELEKALGSKVQYIDLKVNPEVGFRGIMVNGPRGPIKCIPDQNCPATTIFGVQLNSWKLYSLGKAVRVIDSDGLQMLRQSSADGVEVRYGFYGNLGCNAPGRNINISV